MVVGVRMTISPMGAGLGGDLSQTGWDGAKIFPMGMARQEPET